MSESKMREEFEAWYLRNYEWFIAKKQDGYGLDRCAEAPFQYVESIPHHDFRVWQASREFRVIELPKPYAVIGDYAACGGSKAVWDIEYAAKITDRMCEKTAVYDRASLEAVGLKVSQ